MEFSAPSPKFQPNDRWRKGPGKEIDGKSCLQPPTTVNDGCRFLSFNRNGSESLSAVTFLMPEEMSRLALENEAEGKRRRRLTGSESLGGLCASEI
ncbi:hypothetical protein IAR50_007346 [Cryptococcus sp. DSM 104548]